MPSDMKPSKRSPRVPGFPGKQTITDKVGFCEDCQYHFMRNDIKGECPVCHSLINRLKLENDALRKKIKADEGHQCRVLGPCKGECR
jgi:uncharacterized paraquat-inducible protein A